jgi:geranylgeranyl pyrophosphate synthase
MHSEDTISNLGICFDIIDDFLSKAPPKEVFQKAIENRNPVVRSSFIPLFRSNGKDGQLMSKVSFI